MLSADDRDGAGGDDCVENDDGHIDGGFDDANVLWSYIDRILCDGAKAVAQPSFKSLRIFYNENMHLSHAQCLICGFHTSCADKARALSRHFLFHQRKDGFRFDSNVDTAGKLLNAVEVDYLRFRSPSPVLRPPILKTEVQRLIGLDQASVEVVEKLFKCAACNYLAIPAKGQSASSLGTGLHQNVYFAV